MYHLLVRSKILGKLFKSSKAFDITSENDGRRDFKIKRKSSRSIPEI